jgi:RND family efflux transporter MFP subunit
MRKYLYLLLVIVTIGIGVSCDRGPDDTKKEPPAALVKSVVVNPYDADIYREIPGVVIANRKVKLTFLVNGQIVEFPVNEGDLVQQGQVLAKLDERDYRNDYNAALASFQQTNANYSRAKILIKSGTISQAHYEEVEARYLVAKSNMDIAKKKLTDTQLKAPFEGLVAATFVENFENVAAKEPILSLQDITDIDIEVHIPELDIAREKPHQEEGVQGMSVGHVVFPSFPKKKFAVTVKKFETQADPVTQTFLVTLTMKAPENINILPGMTATWLVLDKGGDHDNLFLIPVEAVMTDADGKRYVWVIDPSTQQAKKTQVTVGSLKDKMIFVTQGLKAGDRIISAGMNQVVDGQKVRVQVNGGKP